MKCYNCNNVLAPDKDSCPKCGADVKRYRKIVYASNYYYNVGLSRAKSRNMSGAVEALKIALQISKTNVDARNLLGLIYYEMGETAMAVKEWTISKSIQYRNNPAEQYLSDLKNDKQVLDETEHSIRKFNQALKNAQIGAFDLAIVQLKKVLSVNPRMIKAYQLLSLLYIHEGKQEYAKSTLNKCLELDTGNILAHSYLDELENNAHTIASDSNIVKDIPIAPMHLRDYGSYLGSAVCILLGVILSFGILWYTVLPAQQSKYEKQAVQERQHIEKQLQLANEQIESKDKRISELEENLSYLEDENSELADQKLENEQKITKKEAYELMEKAMIYTVREQWYSLYELYPEIDKAAQQMNDSQYREAYVALKSLYNTKLSTLLVQEGNAKVANGSYVPAIQNYAAAIKLNDGNAEAYYGVAYSYELSSESNKYKTAKEYYNLVLSKFGGTEWAAKAQERLKYIP
ncbi:MAG: hypothetical protein ACI4EL_07345 [Candidatus Fimimorpha sp.]